MPASPARALASAAADLTAGADETREHARAAGELPDRHEDAEGGAHDRPSAAGLARPASVFARYSAAIDRRPRNARSAGPRGPLARTIELASARRKAAISALPTDDRNAAEAATKRLAIRVLLSDRWSHAIKSAVATAVQRKEKPALARFLQTPIGASGGMRSSAGQDPRHRNATNRIVRVRRPDERFHHAAVG